MEAGYWQMSYTAMAVIPLLDFNKVDEDNVVNVFTCGMVAKMGKASTTIAMKEVMEGKKEKDTSFPQVFRSMDIYTVKGGYRIPEE